MSDEELISIAWFEYRSPKVMAPEHLRNYVTMMGESLKKQFESLKSKEDPIEEFSFLDFEYLEFVKILRSSCFVICYSAIERQLMSICEERQDKHTMKLKDVKGDGIELAQIYLKKQIGIDFPDQAEAWMKIQDYRQVRNIIVHNQGFIAEKHLNEKKFQDILRRHPDLAIDKESLNELTISDSFCFEVIDTMQTFFNDLFMRLLLHDYGSKETALRRHREHMLIVSANRLIRLLELGAPDSVIENEIKLLGKHYGQLFPNGKFQFEGLSKVVKQYQASPTSENFAKVEKAISVAARLKLKEKL